MKPTSPRRIALVLAGWAAFAAQAADAPAAAAPAASAALIAPAVAVEAPLEASAAVDKAANEPAVQRTVIDDKRAHIEELRVRGLLRKVTVAPKDGAPQYEILTGDGQRDQTAGANASNGFIGQRVWNVFHF